MTITLLVKVKGGSGSGNYGHAGRPGMVGGSGGTGGGATPKVAALSANMVDDDLKWKTEDSVVGSVTFEYEGDEPDAVQIEDLVQSTDYMHINSEDIEDVEIKGVEHGKGWFRVDVEILPTEEAGIDWLEGGSTAEETHTRFFGGY